MNVPILVFLLINILIFAAAAKEETCSSTDDPTCEAFGKIDDITFEKAAQFKQFLSHMFQKVEDHAATMEKPDRRAQEQHILQSWMKYMEMDPQLIYQTPLESNWLYDLFQSTKSLAPSQFFKIWDERARPTQDELDVLMNLDENAYNEALMPDGQVNQNVLMNNLMMPLRHRGFTMSLLDTFTRVLMGPFKTITYGMLSPANLKAIANYSPLVEVGAGSGYWSAVLQTMGVDITPCDFDPPAEGKKGLYFDRQYTTVQEQDCQSLFASQPANNRTLMMVWPNNPDNVDNAKEWYSSTLPPVWDTACLKSFVAAGGTTVILVAEREVNIHVLPAHPQNPTQADSGLCATRELQQTLLRDFDLVHQMAIPSWCYSDDLTIWKLKEPDATQ